MRGLETRVLLAKARILTLVDACAAERQMAVVGKLAHADGMQDAADGIDTVPIMFADEPNLIQGWQLGQHHYKHFDAAAWRAKCDAWSTSANKHCGCSWDVFMQRFSATVDSALNALPLPHHEAALKIAASFGYETPQAREEADQWNDDHGYCRHGITLGYCPAGCGSGPDD